MAKTAKVADPTLDAAQKQGEPSRPKRGAFRIIAMALILNCRIAVAQPDQYSANDIMPGCRDAAALITFSNPSNDHSDLASFCLGITVGLSYLGRSDGTICLPIGVTREQAVLDCPFKPLPSAPLVFQLRRGWRARVFVESANYLSAHRLMIFRWLQHATRIRARPLA